MKIKLILSSMFFASVAFGQTSSIVISPGPQLNRVVLNAQGTYVHDGDVDVSVLTMDQAGFVLECHRHASNYGISPTSWYSTTTFYPSIPEQWWRERYSVAAGKIILLKVIDPKIIPAQERKIEWPEEDAK